ncbi:hypothetical protein [Candidatus Avelusimicrobium alvi]|uniref:hypothetical protein n=1 Tax=Candidatus Avelusimicrobium alvi TaxID=3416221 RepID=UPI003D11CDD7
MGYISKIRKTIPKWAKFPVFTLINREGNIWVLERENHHARLPHHLKSPAQAGFLFGTEARKLLCVRQDLKGGAMFLFEVRFCTERQKPRARPAGKFRQEFYRKASFCPVHHLKSPAQAGFLLAYAYLFPLIREN